MPYKWVEPDLYLEYFGVRIFHAYDDEWYDQPLSYWFTTSSLDDSQGWWFDARDYVSVVNIAASRDEHCIDNIALKEGIMRAIELQELKLPVDEGVDYSFKRGSFNWYVNHPGEFIQSLSKAIMKADMGNRSKLNKIYRHAMLANATGNWDKIVDGNIIDEPLGDNTKVSAINPENPVRGCFFWYLYHSGSFVTHMANVIRYADNNNRELIRTVYPQMVAAYDLSNWNQIPENFSPVYNMEDAGEGG